MTSEIEDDETPTLAIASCGYVFSPGPGGSQVVESRYV